MEIQNKQIRQARLVSEFTVKECADAAGITPVTYLRKEQEPTKFSLGQFFDIYRAMPAEGQDFMWEFIETLRDDFA